MQIFKVFTGVKIEDKYWNVCIPKKNCPDLDTILVQIKMMETKVLNASLKVRTKDLDPTAVRVRNEFYSQKADNNTTKSFWDLYTEYLNLKTYKPNTKRNMQVFRRHLEYFCNWSGYQFKIDTWDRITFGKYIQFLIVHQCMADFTIHRLVKGIKTFLKFVYPSKDLSWMKYTVLATDEEIVALNEAELL